MGKRMVAIYARVSTEHEAQLAALDNQVQYYRDILKRYPEWEIYDQYIDEGITGTSVKKRKNFLRMIEDAEAGKFDLIITREVSRFARNTVDTLQETRKLKRIGVEVWFTEDNIWTMNDEDGELRLTIMATLAQNESKKTSIRVKAGQMVSFKNGVPYGNGNILGYDKLPNHGGYVINAEQAETVKMIFDLYESGLGERAIAYEMEKRGRLTSMGKTKWHCASIGHMLNNSFYCGIIKYRKQFVPDFLEQKKINNHGNVDYVVVEGTHEPIVSKEQFDRVQGMLNGKRMIHDNQMLRGYKPSDNVWVRKMVCAQCGKRFRRHQYHVYNGSMQYAFQCSTVARYGSIKTRQKKGLSTDGVCDLPMIQEWKIKTMAIMIFSQMFIEKEKIYQIVDKLLTESIACEIGDNSESMTSILEAKKSKVNRQLDNLLDLRLNDAITKEQYVNKKSVLEKQLDSILKEIDEQSSRAKLTDVQLNEKIERLRKTLRKDCELLDKSIPEAMIEDLVEKVVVRDATTFEWYLNISGDEIEYKVTGDIKKNPETLKINKESDSEKFHCHKQHMVQYLIEYRKISKTEFAYLLYCLQEKEISHALIDMKETIESLRNNSIEIEVRVKVRNDIELREKTNSEKRKEGLGFLTSYGYFISLLQQAMLINKEDSYYVVSQNREEILRKIGEA